MNQPFRCILVALDFSPTSGKALETGVELSKRFEAGLHLIHAFDVPVPMFNPYAVSVPVAFVNEAREVAQRKLDESVDRVAKLGVTATAHMAEVPAAPAIVRVAEEVGADLIVMGTRGHTGFKHALLGSVAERTARTAPCSVLTVKAVDADDE